MTQPIKDRPMTSTEVERLRLLLSIFRDGSGQFLRSISGYMPGFLDFERATAALLGGSTSENKNVFDVVVPSPGSLLPFGVSCKMSVFQPVASRASFMELSNSQKKFADEFGRRRIDWRIQPSEAGPAVVDLVMSWHAAEADRIDLDGSRYLVLAHDSAWVNFQLLCFSLNLRIADPREEVEWCNEGGTPGNPSTVAGYVYEDGRRHRLWQLYQRSGGQLKYYPLLAWADWITPTFQLETPPMTGLLDRVEAYFPGMWPSDD